jgi:preprotein translocase subunit SecE
VSDELEATGAAANGGDTTTSGRTAVATRPLRPTGKRSRQVTEAVEAPPIEKADHKKDGRKAKAKTAKKTGPDKGRPDLFAPVVFVWTYLKQVIAELRKVIWPNRKQMMNYTAVVLVFLVFMVALIGVVDLGLAAVVRGVFAGVWTLK